MRKLPKHHPGQIRKTASLSFSLPLELEKPVNQLAAERGMSRSQLIVWLLEAELRKKGSLPRERKAPLRVRRIS